MKLPSGPFAPVPVLFVSAAESDLLAFVRESYALVVGSPHLVAVVDADLDAHAMRKKALRVADADYVRAQTALLPGVAPAPTTVDPRRLALGQGRPRTPGFVVLMAVLLRGYLGAGFKSCDSATMLQESLSLHVMFANMGINMPGQSTLTELVNAVTNATRRQIFDAQIARVLELGWDDFTTMLQDSTHAKGNTAWPTDSRLAVALVARILRIGAQLPRLHLPAIALPSAQNHLSVLTSLDRQIDMMPQSRERPRNRRKLYRTLLWRGTRVHTKLAEAITALEVALTTLDVLPSRKVMAARAVERLRADVDALRTVLDNCEARVVRDEKVPMSDKRLSVSDPDVGYIKKGQREPVVGYKPQLARSGKGFITGLLLPQGNAADSGQLRPMIYQVVSRTGVVPSILSVDDGYASQANVDELKPMKMEVLSISGSKGRALTSAADWNSDAYAKARGDRSAVESTMFTLKDGFDFGEVARRGLDAVEGELLEKVLACNLCHMVRTRQALEAAAAERDHAIEQPEAA